MKITDELLDKIRSKFRENCPLMFDIFRTLFPTDADEECKRKELSIVHALSLLVSLRNKTKRNDVKLFFSILLTSMGVGFRLMNLLSRMNLTLHATVLNDFFDKFVERKMTEIKSLTPSETPLIFLLDNINMYRGVKKYFRLFKVIGPKMWNFTGRGMMIPQVEGIKDLFLKPETSTKIQQDVFSLTCNEIFIEGNKQHLKLWEDWLQYYLLSMIDISLNRTPTKKLLKDMSEKEFNDWLSRADIGGGDSHFKIELPKPEKLLDDTASDLKAKMFILPLSLENNATTTGTAAILTEYANSFDIPCTDSKTFFPFNEETSLILRNPENILSSSA